MQRAISLLEKMQEGKLGKKQEKLSTQIFTLYGKKLACYASGEKSIEIESAGKKGPLKKCEH